MARSQRDTHTQEAQLLPTKDTLTALKSDVNLESAILELCDNALDAWHRTSKRKDAAQIVIDVDQTGESTELVIRDDTGGVPREDAAMLFGLGQTAKNNINGSIGTYGVGAKKSLVNLGVPFKISSRSEDEPIGWTFRITEGWFEDDQDWTVPIDDEPGLDSGVTEIRIEDLNYNWSEDKAETLRSRLGEAYNLFLSEKLQDLHNTDFDLSIKVCGEDVEPEGVPDWSFSPFDGLHPRRFENIQINHPNSEYPVKLNITVGLLRKKDSQNAGTDIYCQKRKIATALRNSEGGFGTEQDHLGNFSARHERLKVIVELETNGDGKLLPWDTQKSSIDRHNPIMRGTTESRGVYNWIRRTVQDYYTLDADKVPRAFVEPFDSNHEYAVNNGVPVCLDYSDRKRVVTNHRPDTDLPDLSQLKSMATAHATLWISCREALEKWKRPAYRTQLDQESNRNVENLTEVSNPPPEHIVNDPHEITGLINELARIHLEHGIYYPDELDEWQIPRYKGYIERHEEDLYQRPDKAPKEVPLSVDEITEEIAHDAETTQKTTSPTSESSATSTDPSCTMEETAEIFLVLNSGSNDERVAKLSEVPRGDLCELLDLEIDADDEAIWGGLRRKFDSLNELT